MIPWTIALGQPYGDPTLEQQRIASLAFQIGNAAQTYSARGGLTGRKLYSRQTDGSSQGAVDRRARNQAYGGLLFVLLMDGTMSYFAASSWNEGVWTGPPTEKPSDALNRALRSLFYPGWGQIYAGDRTTGWALFATGTALILNAWLADYELARAQRKYEQATETAGSLDLLESASIIRNPYQLYSLKAALVYPERIAVQGRDKRKREALAILASFWSVNLVHAIFFSGSGANISLAPFVRPVALPENEEMDTEYGLELQWRF